MILQPPLWRQHRGFQCADNSRGELFKRFAEWYQDFTPLNQRIYREVDASPLRNQERNHVGSRSLRGITKRRCSEDTHRELVDVCTVHHQKLDRIKIIHSKCMQHVHLGSTVPGMPRVHVGSPCDKHFGCFEMRTM